MDPKIGWFQPEQGGRAKEFWMQIWDAHVHSRDNAKSNFHDNTHNVPNKFQENIENIPDNHKRVPLSMNHINNLITSMNKASTYYMNRFQDSLIGKYGGCPWKCRTGYDTNTTVGLHQEIEDFFAYMSPTPEEHQVRLNIVANVTSIIMSLWPDAQVEVFGSFQTSLYLPTSDIDIVVIGEWDQLPLRPLQDALLGSGICEPDNIKVLDKASVPIVKFNDRLSDVKVDISFNMNNGVKSVELIKHYCELFPALKKLVLVLKQFLLQRDLNEVFHGGISSYSLILMCINFLQLHPQQDPCRHDNNLGVLLIDFLELYGRKFNYIKAAISIKNGGSYITKDQLQKDMTDGHRPSILSIEDPLTQGNDIGRGSYGALQVKQAFDYAFVVISQGVSMGIDTNKASILGRVVRVTDRVVDYRIWLRKAFPIIESPSPIPSPHSADEFPIRIRRSSDSDSDGTRRKLKELENSSQVHLNEPKSNHGHLSDSYTTIVSVPKHPRRILNGMRFHSSVTGYLRGGDIGQFQVHHHHQSDIQKQAAIHNIGAVSIPMINHVNHAIPSTNGFQRHMNHEMFSFHKLHVNNGNASNNRFSSHSTIPYFHHKRAKSQQLVRQKNITEINNFR